MNAWPTFPIAPHARLTYQQIDSGSPPLDPPEFPPPEIHPAARRVPCEVQEYATGNVVQEEIYLVRDPAYFADYAYRKVEAKRSVPIERGGQDWGKVMVCVCLRRGTAERRSNMPVFVEPDPNSNEGLVAVKELRKAVFTPFLQNGGPENPYKEIAAMQQIADNRHVLGCIEALEDDKYLYIIMPFCDGGDLFDIIHERGEGGDYLPANNPRPAALPEAHARDCFRQMLECANYLHNAGISHLDISPENVMIKNGRCILIDLGCTLPVPVPAPGNGQRALLRRRGLFGKMQYIPWEIPSNRHFDGFGVDLWSLAITLYHMLVGETLGRSAAWVTRYDNLISFISNSPHLAGVTQNMNGRVVNLLNSILQRDPASRANLEQVVQDLWVASAAIPFVPLEHYLE